MSNDEEIKVGSLVFVDAHRGSSLRRVERATKTQWVLDNGDRFNRETLCRVGEKSWSVTTIRHAGDDDIRRHKAARRRTKMVRRAMGIRWSDMSDETLAAVLAAVDADQKSQPGKGEQS